MTGFEQKGYDAWIELWADYGCAPRASQCPARYLQGETRNDFIKGWLRAKNEHEQGAAAKKP